MSTYQYHEWQTIDGALSAAEQKAVRKLSSHMEVHASRAVVTYNWSDFRHDPQQVLLDYFDAYLYLANWGSKCLMFRFPRGILNDEAVAPFLIDELISWETHGDFQVLAIDFNDEEGAGWIEEDAGLSDFIPLRADLMAGDYRLLYLAWMKALALEDEAWHDGPAEAIHANTQPPIPPGLKALSPALSRFADIFEVDRHMIAAAAELSAQRPVALPPDYAHLVAGLSREECDRLLTAIAEGKPGAVHALRRRLQPFSAPHSPITSATYQTYDQLRQRARKLAEAERRAAAEEAHRQHVAAMEALAPRKEAVWEEIVEMLDHGQRSAAVYARATELVTSLVWLAEFQGEEIAFRARLADLAERYARRKALLRRWREQELL